MARTALRRLFYAQGERVRGVGGKRLGTIIGAASQGDMTVLGRPLGSPFGWYWVEWDGDGFSALQHRDWMRPADEEEAPPKRDRWGWAVLPWPKRIRRWVTWRRVDGGGFQRRRWLRAWMRLRFGPDPEF